MNNEDIKYAIPACTHLLCLYWVLSLLSTKVGVHVTAVVLRGQSLKMVKPCGDARVFSFLLTSCFDKKKQKKTTTRRPQYDIRVSFLKDFIFDFFGHKQALNKSNFFSITQKKQSVRSFLPPPRFQWIKHVVCRLWWSSRSTCVGCFLFVFILSLFLPTLQPWVGH